MIVMILGLTSVVLTMNHEQAFVLSQSKLVMKGNFLSDDL